MRKVVFTMSLFFSFPKSYRHFVRCKSLLHERLEVSHKYGEYIIRQLSQEDATRKFVPFFEALEARRNEAKRSILVQVQSAQSYKELHSYCTSFGPVNKMLHYSIGVEPLNFIVVEFEQESHVDQILLDSSHSEETRVPVHSHFLWFRASSNKLPKLKQSKSASLGVENGTKILKETDIRTLLKDSDSISSQMETLYQNTKLNDIGIRLRFLTARQVESVIKGMFPTVQAYPFGSSVNGCGKMGCDLDLVLRFSKNELVNQNSRLVFHCKEPNGSERMQMQVIGDLIKFFLPGCSQVRSILQARVPIIKYYQHLTNTECDLSMSNMSGVHMSDFLYIMGSLDERVWPLIFTIRKWACEIGLTNPSPGRWVTNFSLTLLVLSFLQKPLHSQPILPSLNTLVSLAQPNDHFITEDGIDCTFLRDITKIQSKPSQNQESLESLLREFFEYYAQFDFANKAVCLNEAVCITKSDHAPMYIINPLEKNLNVSKNVSLDEMEKFKVECRNAAWHLTSEEDKKTSNWGVLTLLESKRKPNPFKMMLHSKQQNRMMEVKALFNEEDEEIPVQYKNDSVKKQVQNIKKQRQEKLKEIKKLNR